MQHGRKRIAAGVTSAIAIIGFSIIPATPSNADPDIDDVKSRVDKLYHQGEQASERYNDAKLKLDDLEADLFALKADEKKQQAKVDTMTSAVSEAVAAQYEGQNVSATGQLVLSQSPDQFLSELTTLSAYNDVQADAVDDYTREADALSIRREATQERADELADTEAELQANKDEADGKLAEAKALLGDLEAEERAELEAQEEAEAEASRAAPARTPTTAPSTAPTTAPSAKPDASPPVASAPASGRAAAAVQYALGQVGDSYVFGAAGPSAFDCSGLTMMAWSQAGVGLPHSSGAQMGSGSRVSSDSLQPGDLVFYYSPVSHVGIYIGGGRIVHAANPGTGDLPARRGHRSPGRLPSYRHGRRGDGRRRASLWWAGSLHRRRGLGRPRRLGVRHRLQSNAGDRTLGLVRRRRCGGCRIGVTRRV